MNCRSGRSTSASQRAPIPELLHTKRKRTPAARSCSATSSPPVPTKGVARPGAAPAGAAMGASAPAAERAAARLNPAAVAVRTNSRREMRRDK